MTEAYDIIYKRSQIGYTRAKEQRNRDIAVVHPYTGEEISDPWYYFDRMYRGFQYDFANKMASWASMPVTNKVFAGVESYTTMLCDNKPTIIVSPREASDEERVETARAAVKYWWESSYMDSIVALGVKTSRIFGIGWLHTYYDDETKTVKCNTVHPTHILVDPDCTVENFDPTYLIYEYKAQYGELKARFDGKELQDGYVVDFSKFSKNKDWHIEVPMHDMESRRYEDNLNPANSVNVYEFWIKDAERVTWDETEEGLDGKVIQKSKKKFPKGRVITIAGGMVIDDKPNPYDHGEFPFTPIHAYTVPGRFYGIGDVQMVMNIQAMRNRLVQMINDQTMKAGGGYIFVGQASGVDPKKVGNLPVNIVPCRDPNAIRIDRPPAPPRHVFDFISVMDKDFDDTMGIHEISRGGTLSSHRTAQEISVMAESDRTRVRQAARYLVWALMRAVRQIVWDLSQFHTGTWFLRIAGNPFEETIPDDEEAGQAGIIPNFREREFNGKEFLNYTKDELKYDFIIEDASMLPTTQNEKTTNVTQWVQLGLVTPEEVLKYKLIDIPEADRILADRANAQPLGPSPEEAAMMGAAPPGAVPPGAMMGAVPTPEMTGGGMSPDMMGGMMPPEMMGGGMPMMGGGGEMPPDMLAQLLAGAGGGMPPAMPEPMPMPPGGPDMGLVEGLAGPQMSSLPPELMEIAQRLADEYGMSVEDVIDILMQGGPIEPSAI